MPASFALWTPSHAHHNPAAYLCPSLVKAHTRLRSKRCRAAWRLVLLTRGHPGLRHCLRDKPEHWVTGTRDLGSVVQGPGMRVKPCLLQCFGPFARQTYESEPEPWSRSSLAGCSRLAGEPSWDPSEQKLPCSAVLGAACTADMWERLARWSNASKHLLLWAPLLVGGHEKLPHELLGLQHSLAAAAQRTCKVHLGLVPAGHETPGMHALAVSPACRGYWSLPLASPQLPRSARGCPQQQQAVQQSLMLPVARP